MESKSPQDCFAQFDAAFAEWSAELAPQELASAPAPPLPPPAPPADFSAEDNDAFDRIDTLLLRADTISTHSAAAAAPIELWNPRDEQATPLERVLGTVENIALVRTTIAGNRALDEASRVAFMRVLQDARDLCDDFARQLRSGPKPARTRKRHSSDLRVLAVAADRKGKK